MKVGIALLFAIALGFLSHFGLVAGASAEGIEGRINVSGRDASGGVFWVIIVSAHTPQPITLADAKAAAVRTDNNRFVADLSPGDYVVALVESPTAMVQPPAQTLKVTDRDGRLMEWPAINVEVTSSTPRVVANFQRKPYPDMPPGLEIPHTESADVKGPGPQSMLSDAILSKQDGQILGLFLLGASGAIGILVARRWYKVSGNRQ